MKKQIRLCKTKAGMGVRQATDKILEMVDDGILDKDMVIMACLKYMSEDDVADMAHCNEFFLNEEDEVTEGKIKPKLKITKKEWNKTHKDYKSIINGVHYVMKLTDKGTALVPVGVYKTMTGGGAE
jgi:hypothetical protein|tara:strand:+ start:4980 stop:5357 length:378 start_codon:yes stop_codon:yes gene_type:complete